MTFLAAARTVCYPLSHYAFLGGYVYVCVCPPVSQILPIYTISIVGRAWLHKARMIVHPIAVPCPHGNHYSRQRDPWGLGTAPGWSYRPSGGAPSAAPNLGACRFHYRCQLRPPIPPHHGLRGAANATHLVTILGESNLIHISMDLERTLPRYGTGCKQGTIDTAVHSY